MVLQPPNTRTRPRTQLYVLHITLPAVRLTQQHDLAPAPKNALVKFQKHLPETSPNETNISTYLIYY